MDWKTNIANEIEVKSLSNYYSAAIYYRRSDILPCSPEKYTESWKETAELFKNAVQPKQWKRLHP